MIDILFEPLKNWGVEIMFPFTLGYLFFIWNWSPYNQAVNFHNMALRFNHFTVCFFLAFNIILQRLKLPAIAYSILICLNLAMLVVVSFIGFIRIVVEVKFRKRLLEDHTLMGDFYIRT